MTFNVAGMTCGGCVRAVTNAIRRVDEDAVVTRARPLRSSERRACPCPNTIM
ncbi:MAG: heavy-metal-associated domain-containing protein [Novosphingobium sp.]|nr:heavy-metal-associated domain-containing protein [Novosphingobium sp.]